MATSEQSVLIDGPMPQALIRCAQAMTEAKLKDVQIDEPGGMVAGKRRSVGQWTSNVATAFLAPAEANMVRVTVRADVTAQSLVSLVISPAERMVQDVVAQLAK